MSQDCSSSLRDDVPTEDKDFPGQSAAGACNMFCSCKGSAVGPEPYGLRRQSGCHRQRGASRRKGSYVEL